MSNYFEIEIEWDFQQCSRAIKSLNRKQEDAVASALQKLADQLGGAYHDADYLVRIESLNRSGMLDEDVREELAKYALKLLPVETKFTVRVLCTDNLPWSCKDYAVPRRRKTGK